MRLSMKMLIPTMKNTTKTWISTLSDARSGGRPDDALVAASREYIHMSQILSYRAIAKQKHVESLEENLKWVIRWLEQQLFAASKIAESNN